MSTAKSYNARIMTDKLSDLESEARENNLKFLEYLISMARIEALSQAEGAANGIVKSIIAEDSSKRNPPA